MIVCMIEYVLPGTRMCVCVCIVCGGGTHGIYTLITHNCCASESASPRRSEGKCM